MESDSPGSFQHWFTVFTPAYNRAHLIHRCYESLEKQRLRDFEWLVIDDGSRDGTGAVIAECTKKATFPIRYQWQTNAGFHVAFNRGVAEARGFFVALIDDDDWLEPDALATCLAAWQAIPASQRENFVGVTGLCRDPAGTLVGVAFPADPLDSDLVELQNRGKGWGEKWGVLRTDVLRAYPFPTDAGSYLPTSLLWNRIAQRYKTRFVNRMLAVKDFQPQGGTALSAFNRARHPVGQVLYYREYVMQPRPLRFRVLVRNSANLVRFALHAGSLKENLPALRGPLAIMVAVPLGIGLYLRDRWARAFRELRSSWAAAGERLMSKENHAEDRDLSALARGRGSGAGVDRSGERA